MAKPMPGKLIVTIVFMSLGIAANLVSGGLLGCAIGVALLVGVLVGNDGVRKFLIGLSALQAGWSAFILFGIVSLSHGRSLRGFEILVIGLIAVFSIGFPLVYMWVFTREDVRDWMFRKNFHLDDDASGEPPKV